MKTLNKYIQEKYLIDIDTVNYKYSPKTFDYLQNIIIEKVKYFDGDLKNDILDLNDINTSEITSMSELFNDWEIRNKIYRINISQWDVSKVKDMYGMFAKCSNLITVGDLNYWNTKNLEDTSYMFQNCTLLENIGNIDNWNLKKLISAEAMFSFCGQLKTIGDISNWDLKDCVNMNAMFYNCYNIKDLGNLNNLKLDNMPDTSHMFHGCKSLKNIPDWYK